MPVSERTLGSVLQRTLTFATVLASLLVGAGLLVFPESRADWRGTLPGLIGVGIMLLAYALLGVWGAGRLQRTDGRLLRVALSFGIIVATVYATEVILEYLLLPSDNTRYGYVEFGLVFLSYISAGLIAGVKTRRARHGLIAALGAALIGTLVWYIVLLATTYIMKGTPQQALVFHAEGNMDDFARSGSASFEAWLMQDFLNAGFYHLLLSLVISAVLGLLGGSIGKIFTHKPNPDNTAGI